MLLIGMGANLPAPDGRCPLTTCQDAAFALAALPGLKLAALSNWYETDAMPPSGQPPYINGVARLEGKRDPLALLRDLQTIERQYGRQRSVPNAARTLDLDIVAMADFVQLEADPIIPHPRMHQRAFVLMPLLDVAPDWYHPVLHASARSLLAGLPAQGVRLASRSHLRDELSGPMP